MSRMCFTINNYAVGHMIHLRNFAQEYCKYLVFGREEGENKTPHLQGFFILNKKKTRGALDKLIAFEGKRAWFAMAVATSKQASDYCKKDGDFEEIGDCPREPGEAGGAAETDRWDLIYEAIDDCDTWEEFFVWLQSNMRPKEVFAKMACFQNTFNMIKRKKVPKFADVICEWFMGPPGTGKSHTAREENPSIYVKCPTGRFFCGYDNEPCILFDDVDHNSAKDIANILKQVADKYAVIVEVKCGSMKIRPTKVIVTSNYSIETLFPEPTLYAALDRRFKVRKFSNVYVPPAPVATGNPAANPDVIDLASDEEKNDARQAPPPRGHVAGPAGWFL